MRCEELVARAAPEPRIVIDLYRFCLGAGPLAKLPRVDIVRRVMVEFPARLLGASQKAIIATFYGAVRGAGGEPRSDTVLVHVSNRRAVWRYTVREVESWGSLYRMLIEAGERAARGETDIATAVREVYDRMRQTIARLYEEGVPVKKIVERLGLSYSLVYRVIDEAGVMKRTRPRRPGRRLTEEEQRLIIEMWRSGAGLAEIARRLGRSRSTVWRVLKRSGVLP